MIYLRTEQVLIELGFSAIEEYVIIIIYNKMCIKWPTTPAACGGTGSYVKISENFSRPILSLGLRRHTTTPVSLFGDSDKLRVRHVVIKILKPTMVV